MKINDKVLGEVNIHEVVTPTMEKEIVLQDPEEFKLLFTDEEDDAYDEE